MNLVKTYKDVKIFVNNEGEFYCNVNNNSNDYLKKTFSSLKLVSLEKAIDEFKGEEVDGNSYYKIDVYSNSLEKLKVIRKVGDRCFFDNKTDTSRYSLKKLYPESIEQTSEFEKINNLFIEIEQVKQIRNELYQKETKLRDEANKIVKSLKLVEVK